jgi:sugar O-acyltransferase (sialic acid O-acetyltransferase NeuD family)
MELLLPTLPKPELPVVILGQGPLAVAVAEALQQLGTVVYGYIRLDKEQAPEWEDRADVPMLGALTDAAYRKMLQTEKLDYVVAETEPAMRRAIFKQVFELANRLPTQVISVASHVSPFADLAQGVIALPSAVVHAYATLEALCVVNSTAVIEAEARLGIACSIGAGAIVGEGAQLGDEVVVGRGAVVRPGIKLGNKCTVGPGAVVMQDAPEYTVLFGNPAKPLER